MDEHASLESCHEREINKIIGEFNCPKGFRCYKSGFNDLCRAEDIGSEPFLECLDHARGECPFVLTYANVHFCDCPLRFYILKTLNK